MVLMRDFSGDHLVLGRARARRVEQRSVRTSTGRPWIPRCQGLGTDDPLHSRLLFGPAPGVGRLHRKKHAAVLTERRARRAHAQCTYPKCLTWSHSLPRIVSIPVRYTHGTSVTSVTSVTYAETCCRRLSRGLSSHYSAVCDCVLVLTCLPSR